MASDQSPPRADSRRDTVERAAPAGKRASTRRRVLQTLGAVGAVGVAGCSNPLSLGGPAPEWRRSIPTASAVSPPAVSDSHLLVGAQDKQLHAFDVASGDRAFTYETGGPIEARPVTAGGDSPYHVRSTDGDVYTVDGSGDRLWSHEGVAARGELARAGALLVENVPQYDDPCIRGFDAETGAVQFTMATNHYRLPGLTAAGFALSLPVDTDHDRVTVLSLTDGGVHWETDLLPSYVGVIADEELVAVYHDDTITAYAIGDGTRQWQQELDDIQWSSPLSLGTQVYLIDETDDHEGIVALDRASGVVRWRQPAGYQIRHVEPSADAVFVGSRVDDPDGGVNARLDCFETDGTRRWKTVSTVPDVDDIAVLEGTVLLASDRQLVALDRSTGATQWTHEPESSSRLDLVSDANSVYVSYLDHGAVAKFSLS